MQIFAAGQQNIYIPSPVSGLNHPEAAKISTHPLSYE